MASQTKNASKKRDYERWARVSQKNYQRSKALVDRYSNITNTASTRKELNDAIKEAKKFTKKMYEEAEYTDYYDNTSKRWKNYND